MVHGITLNGKYFTRDWIKKKSNYRGPSQLTDHEIKVLDLCGKWLRGGQNFSVRTSGSTGEPKSILLTRTQMTSSARMTAQALNLKKGDRAFVCLSPENIGGLMMLVRGLVLDLDLTIVEPRNNPLETFGEGFKEHRLFDLTALVPLQLQSILSSELSYLSILNKMKAILLGGAPISFNLKQKLQIVSAPIYHTFGMTETASHIALRRLNGPLASENYQTLPGVEIGQDKRGCLTIRSAVTNNKLRVTNDLVELKSDNSFTWLGRIDNVINTGGVKVQAENVENAVEEAVQEIEDGKYASFDFFVAPVPDEKYGQAVTVVFEGLAISSEISEKLSELLSQKLNKYEVPKKYLTLEHFVHTSNGKINRAANIRKIAVYNN